MELYDEEKEQKKSKAPMIIGICIAILVAITIMIVVGIIYLKNSITIIQIDGQRNTSIYASRNTSNCKINDTRGIKRRSKSTNYIIKYISFVFKARK